jgi:serine/threonine protein phosphatase 1
MKKFVIGDIHGHCRALLKVLEKSGFDADKDLLISLGDVVDLGPDPVGVINTLQGISHLVHVLGNHDNWCINWMKHGNVETVWRIQGGQETINAYKTHEETIPSHLNFLEQARPFYLDEEKRLFVHGGFDWNIPIEKQKDNKQMLLWDRSLAQMAFNFEMTGKKIEPYANIFLGHTPTRLFGSTEPIHQSNIWLMDTGCGRGGKLTMMDVESEQFWQSDEI